VTLWPGVLPLPTVTRFERYRLNEAKTAIVASGFSVPLSRTGRVGEIYLRLTAVDLDDPEAVLAFAQNHGTPSGVLVHNMLKHSLAFTSSFTPARQVAAQAAALDAESESGLASDVTMLESFRFSARCFQDLVTAWRIVRGDPVETSSHRWELALRGEMGKPLESAYSPELTALLLLTDGLTGLLGHVRPLVLPTPSPDELAGEPAPPSPTNIRGAEVEIPRTRWSTNLTELCALELFNHVAENATYRTCENETCQRPFVRQYGRAMHGQSKVQGIKYCSSACAQAQTQRMYRRRRRARTAST
jgi:hypothetical protein